MSPPPPSSSLLSSDLESRLWEDPDSLLLLVDLWDFEDVFPGFCSDAHPEAFRLFLGLSLFLATEQELLLSSSEDPEEEPPPPPDDLPPDPRLDLVDLRLPLAAGSPVVLLFRALPRLHSTVAASGGWDVTPALARPLPSSEPSRSAPSLSPSEPRSLASSFSEVLLRPVFC